MPWVKVKWIGDLWKIKDDILVLKDGANIYDLIKAFDAQYGTKMWKSSINMNTMDLQEDSVILVNSRPVRGKLDTPLIDGDVITIIPNVGCC